MRIGAILLAACVLCVACTDSSKAGNQSLERMAFDSAPEMLGVGQVLGDSLEYHPPLGWNPLPGELLAGMQASMPTDQALVQQVVAAFTDSTMSSMLVVSSLDRAEGITEKAHLLLEAGLPENAQRAEFLLSDFHCRQYLVQQAQRVQFRLLLDDHLLFDYLVPMQGYETNLEFLEASIGSIHLSH